MLHIVFYGAFLATGVNINALFVQGSGDLLFAFGLMVGFLLAWDIKHQPVASVPSTQNVNPWRSERLGEFDTGQFENRRGLGS